MSFLLLSGGAIEHICEETQEEVLSDRTALIRAARCLLGAVTRVLLLADIVVVKQLLLAKDKVRIIYLYITNTQLKKHFILGFT